MMSLFELILLYFSSETPLARSQYLLLGFDTLGRSSTTTARVENLFVGFSIHQFPSDKGSTLKERICSQGVYSVRKEFAPNSFLSE